MVKGITSSHTKGPGSLLHVIRKAQYKYGTNIDPFMRNLNVSFMKALSVREGMEIFNEAIIKFNSEPQVDTDGIIKKTKTELPNQRSPAVRF